MDPTSFQAEVFQSFLVGVVFSFMDTISLLQFLSSSKYYYHNTSMWDMAGKQLHMHEAYDTVLKDISDMRQKIFHAAFDLGVVCLSCGFPLDSVFGFFLYRSKKCFDCQRNRLAHTFSYDPMLLLRADETEHFIENFGLQFHNTPISGTIVLNAYGCFLGGGYYFLMQKDGNPIKHGKVIDLAAEIFEEKRFFKKYLPSTVFNDTTFGDKASFLMIMMKSVCLYHTIHNTSLYH